MNEIIKIIFNRTLAKVICLFILLTPLWGFWWFNIDYDNFLGYDSVGNYSIFSLLMTCLARSVQTAVKYASICVLTFVSFVVVTFIRPSLVRVPLMLIMLIAWAFELLILDINGTLSNQNLLWTLWQERASAQEVAGGYVSEISRDSAFVFSVGLVLCASPTRRFSLSGIFGLLPLVSGLLVTAVIIHTQGFTQVFPLPFGILSNAGIVVVSALKNGSAEARPLFNKEAMSRDVALNRNVEIEGLIHPIFNKIVVIMDESVRGDYLSLNNPNRNTTPFLRSTSHLVNFGVAISGANCSTVSRMVFRFGMRQSDLPDKWREGLAKPTFWQFAHRAGFKTVYVDAWYGPLSFGSGFTAAEKSLIDVKINILDDRLYMRDHEAVVKILQALNDDGPALIYVDKRGVHFPYFDKYPPDFQAFPIPLESQLLSPLSSDAMIAHYGNAIAWSVDEFFRKLLPSVDLSKTLIIYTSDHGQSMLPGRGTHCSSTPNVPRGEAYVPLLAITSAQDFERRLREGAERGFGRFSHFEVFPTLLLAMGYDANWVDRSYGPSLLDSPSPGRKFMIGNPSVQPMMVPADRVYRPAFSAR